VLLDPYTFDATASGGVDAFSYHFSAETSLISPDVLAAVASGKWQTTVKDLKAFPKVYESVPEGHSAEDNLAGPASGLALKSGSRCLFRVLEQSNPKLYEKFKNYMLSTSEKRTPKLCAATGTGRR
jgi:hypothetical protein